MTLSIMKQELFHLSCLEVGKIVHKKEKKNLSTYLIKFKYYLFSDQVEANQNGTEVEEAMDVEAGQFEDAEEEP